MTACEHVRPELGGYILGALEPEEEAAVREHLATCAQCAAEHASMTGLPRLLALAAPMAEAGPPAPAVEERVLDAIAGERPQRSPRRRLPRLRALAAAAAALAAVAVALLARRAFGGITGDVLGAVEQVAECLVLVTVSGLAARHTIWWG